MGLWRSFTYTSTAIRRSVIGTSRYRRLLLAVLQMGVAGAAGRVWSTRQGSFRAWADFRSSEGFWKGDSDTPRVARPSTKDHDVNTSALSLRGIGSDLSDYKKRYSSVTLGSNDRRRVAGIAVIGWPYLYRVTLARPDCVACRCCKMHSNAGFKFFRASIVSEAI